MEIKGKVHCFFEQSGTFKNEFIKLGIPAEDYDIQDNFGETDHVIDLFHEIDSAYDGKSSLFDSITNNDLIVAFYPCIYFCAWAQFYFNLDTVNYRKLSHVEQIDKVLERSKLRAEYYDRLLRFISVCLKKNIRMVFENPWAMQHYFKNGNFLKPPDIVDNDRTKRGDLYKKPTAFWFWNCKPTHGSTYQPTDPKLVKKIIDGKAGIEAGVCSEDRSMISPDYARNWICDFILGKKQEIGQLSLF